ncbi:plant/F25P12-18 protein [Tanacetum coccineum]
MSLATDDIRASATELYHGDKICKAKTKTLLSEVGFPNGLLPLEDIEECGFVKDTAYVEKAKIKKLTGVKTKEMMMWINLSEFTVDDPPTGKITFKSPTGLFHTFPTLAFEVEEEKTFEVKEVVPKEEHDTVLSMPTGIVEENKGYICPTFHQCDFGDNHAPNKEAVSKKGKEKIEHFGIKLEYFK